jgi:hypothetical protein
LKEKILCCIAENSVIKFVKRNRAYFLPKKLIKEAKLIKQGVPQTVFCVRLEVEPTQMSPIERARRQKLAVSIGAIRVGSS